MSVCSASDLFFKRICFWSSVFTLMLENSWRLELVVSLGSLRSSLPPVELDLLVFPSASLEFPLKQAVLCARSHLKMSLIWDDKTGKLISTSHQSGVTSAWSQSRLVPHRFGN